MKINDSHCHFFSRRFFQVLATQKGKPPGDDSISEIVRLLDWEEPGPPVDLASRWIMELDANGVGRAALMASVPGDEESVAAAVAQYPDRLVGLFMLDPLQQGAAERVRRAVVELGLRCICLFPAMHRYHIYQEEALAVFEMASNVGAVVFVHCGVLSVGVRKKLGLPSPFALRYSNPLDLHSVALDYPHLPIVVPHFGAGMFREALMVADLCPNLYLDTSSSNSWVKYDPSLSLEEVFRRAIEVVGADRLLFGTDSSFFPRGWQKPVWESQSRVLERIGAKEEDRRKILGQNFDALFPPAGG